MIDVVNPVRKWEILNQRSRDFIWTIIDEVLTQT